DTLPTATAQYAPLVTPSGVVGVMGVRMRRSEQPSVDQEALLGTFVSHIALAVERELLGESSRRAEVLTESERLYATLLDSVSQELRTPIASISKATTNLLTAHQKGDEKAEIAFGDEIQDTAKQLNRVVDNLLDMTRLQSGHLKLNLDWYYVNDLINQSIRRVSKELLNHDVVIDI